MLYPKPAAVYIRDAQKLGFKPLNIGQSGIADPTAFEEQVGVPGATQTFRTISPVKYTPEDPAMDKWRKLVEAKFPGDRLSVYNLFGIGSAQVLVEALKRAGPDLTREKLQAAFATIKEFKTDVHPGPVTCSESDHRCHKSPAWLAKDPGGPIRVLGVTTVENCALLLFSYLLMSGVTTGALYGLVALGFVVVNKATGVINFAQGEFFMFTGFIAWMLHVQLGIDYFLTFAVAVACGFLLGCLTDRVAFRAIAKSDVVSLVLATVGVAFVLKGLARTIWGGKADYLAFPPITSPDPIMVGNVMVIPQQLAVLAGTALMAPFGRRNVLLALLAAAIVLPAFANVYHLFIANLILVYVLLAIGLNILVGYAGQLAFANAAMFGIGAYATGLLQVRLGWSFWLAFPSGALLATVVGLVISLPALRLSGLYLALSTLAFAQATQWVFLHWESVTFGAGGFKTPPLSFAPLPIDKPLGRLAFIT